jgi:colanic acid/amylovoran biosynthesis glycosyltransferase
VEYGIRAVADVLKEGPHLEYRVVGDGPLSEQLQTLIDELDMGDRIALLGWKTQAEIAELMRGSDIFLAPSVTSSDGEIEGIPVVLMEAMARGIPVISTWHAGIPELVQDGVSGYLVPERNVEALSQRLLDLSMNPALWSAMGRAGRERVERNHDIEKLNDHLEQLYERLIDGPLR